MTDIAKRISNARMQIIMSHPFWGSLLMRLEVIRDDSRPTFCTDGKSIRYNEAFAAKLTDPQLRFILVHEVCHCAQGHLWRMASRNPHLWNVATDYQVNQMLADYVEEQRQKYESQYGSGRYIAPWEHIKGGLIDPKFRALGSEQIYNKLSGQGKEEGEPTPGEFEQPQGEKGKKGAKGDQGSGEQEGPGSPSEQEAMEAMENDWKMAVCSAAMSAKMRGNLPGCIARMVEQVLEPKVSWRQELREYIRQFDRSDYNWSRPNTRYLGHGFVLPSLHGERLGRIVIAVDTSGSINQTMLDQFQSEIQCALDECSPEAIEVIYCDAAINGTAEFLPGDFVKLQMQGGGGTDFRPVFTRVNAGEPPVALIYLTDGWGTFPQQEPEYPVLWATTDSDRYPWGTVVGVKD